MATVEELVREGVERRIDSIRALDTRFPEVQRAKLLSIVARNAETEFGREHGFERIDSVARWREAVPPTGPADYAERWRRTTAGERGLLCVDPVHAYAISSGTTGESKMIPVTKALVRGLKRAIGYTTTCYLARTRRWSLLRGHALQVTAPSFVRTAPDGKPAGYITGLMGAARSYPFHKIGIPPEEVLDIPDWSEKFRVIGDRYADADVRMLFGVPGIALILIRDLLRRTGHDTLRGLWPGMELVVTSGSPLDHDRETLARLVPGAELLEMYLATEAPVAYQPEPDARGLMPLVEDCYFEFVPEEERGSERPPRFGLDEVERGVRYELLITTPAGLYAYSPGDLVEFESTRPPRMLAAGREGSILSLTAEKVDALHVERAFRELGVAVDAFTGCPLGGDEAGHEWVVELAGEAPPDLEERLDRRLRAINPLYETVRGDGGLLRAARVTRVPRGTFARALARRPGQAKILRVYQDRRVRDELVALGRAANGPGG